jgi:RNA 2',3'-cyclic 3'-phosphodiesterase
MRLFTGLTIEYSVRRNLELVLEHLRPLADIHWSPSANFHITTCFIGNFPDDSLPALQESLTNLPMPGNLDLRLDGFGWFPNPHQPRSLFAAVRAPRGLYDLAASTAEACAALGVAQESRPYTPHLTLARIKSPVELAPLRQAIAQLPSADFGKTHCTRHLLYKSVAGPSGSTYSVIGEFPLA